MGYSPWGPKESDMIESYTHTTDKEREAVRGFHNMADVHIGESAACMQT